MQGKHRACGSDDGSSKVSGISRKANLEGRFSTRERERELMKIGPAAIEGAASSAACRFEEAVEDCSTLVRLVTVVSI